MTIGSGGVRRWPTVCPYCGKTYIATNWMRRQRNTTDTHQLACKRRQAEKGGEG